MAFLAPAVRWPDALQSQLSQWGVPLSSNGEVPPALLIGTAVTLILLTTALTYAFRRTPRGITAQPISIGAGSVSARAAAGVAKRRQPLSTVLLGPQNAGKTALYATLLYGTTPHTQTSQRASSVALTIESSSQDADGEEWARGTTGKLNLTLHDLPGHPRLRPIAKHAQLVAGADVLLFCIDTLIALGSAGGAAAGGGSAETLSSAVDYLHTTLMNLARQQTSPTSKTKKAIPPSFAILLTRADLSPLLASSTTTKDKSSSSDPTGDKDAAAAAAAARAKRHHQAASSVLLSRARTALETELRKRRAADVDLASSTPTGAAGAHGPGQTTRALAPGEPKARAKIGGMSQVALGEGGGGSSAGMGGVVGQVLGIFGLGGLLGSRSSKGGAGDLGAEGGEGEEEYEDEVPDYYLGGAGGGGSGGGGAASSSFSLDKLDPDVVFGGRVPILLSTVGRERGWDKAAVSNAGFDGLAELRRWLVDLGA